MVVDDERDIIVSEHLIDDTPVFDHVVLADLAEIDGFLQRVRFPGHALVVRPNAGERSRQMIFKGVRATDTLAGAIADCVAVSEDGLALVQTDMRAHMNATRMAAISRLACSYAGSPSRASFC